MLVLAVVAFIYLAPATLVFFHVYFAEFNWLGGKQFDIFGSLIAAIIFLHPANVLREYTHGLKLLGATLSNLFRKKP